MQGANDFLEDLKGLPTVSLPVVIGPKKDLVDLSNQTNVICYSEMGEPPDLSNLIFLSSSIW